MISLHAINKNNWEDCIRLKPKAEQAKWIAPNLYSIAEAQFMEGFRTRAIYHDEDMIGFVMYGVHTYDDNYWIYRFMIDEHYQGLHYAKPALRLVLEEIRSAPDQTKHVMLCYKKENERAERLYLQTGFRKAGIAPWGDMMARYTFAG
ncbi:MULTISPECIES: GNAT family N-acetyltransferase [Paenibacillus]|jgi:diamine N-acetyltransferase|uniref:GCN5-related N-acetyltransferase n=2 Tax=Paenibacillus lactis TaxID=228574 RepID=G4HG69_9BACL|nr:MULTISPECIES: GNAT family N-acetyltransferase [Paenibacillus]EHB64080.1 GCN5-related N-acetyltransferase [Paenibacillus lactis 154]MBP1895275.1 diamine N-acetyltransferase [Paenibacillus lactis]GIO93982.1 spermidine acetyltransferase [Paenibacillus lactis]HAF97754.1 N-acetyltransferase [Paenibacillus lactis]